MSISSRQAGGAIIVGIVGAIVWRLVVAPLALGDFDPSDLAHRDRAFLSIGNVFVGLLFAVALFGLSEMTREKSERLSLTSRWSALIAAGCGVVGTAVLVVNHAGVPILYGYALFEGIAWLCGGLAIWRTRGGGVGLAGLITGLLYGAAAAAIFAGAYLIFVMTVAALPLAFALVVKPMGPARRMTAAAG
jgi:hypothetical protein